MLEVDKILEKCGSFGRLQLIIVILTSLLNVILSLHYESEEIIFFVPRHWCADGLASGSAPPNTSSCKPLYSNLTIHSSCHKYKYETYMDFQSFVSETNWICKNGWRMNVGGSLYTVSSLLGTLVLGYMGDKVGRLPALILANLISMSGNFLTIFGTNLFTFCLFRLINGFATDTNYAMMYILLLEYIRPSLRTICLTITVGIFYCLGAISSPWVGLLLGTWRSFLLVSSLPLILVPFFYCIVPESVEWLISRRNYNKAVASLRRVAKINGVQIEDSVYEEFIANCKLVQQNTKIDPNLLDLFRTPRLRRIVLILAFDMAVISYCHFIAIRKLNRNWFSHFVWNSIQYTMILPSWLIALAFQDIIGRKALTSTSLICCCLFISITNIVLLDGASDTNRSKSKSPPYS
ncbi:organic cation transporter-like protein isoform X2 [Drosophila novamexicana]|uniref:organic cation transporter-like protein isoform X2 n=1 Tax=Drosophila novamexicana TaxID=47314 RepID=UPI0011E5BB5B|nr:organic cation transporter-like protein isoform X2 [Drosophila novamexicana]